MSSSDTEFLPHAVLGDSSLKVILYVIPRAGTVELHLPTTGASQDENGEKRAKK